MESSRDNLVSEEELYMILGVRVVEIYKLKKENDQLRRHIAELHNRIHQNYSGVGPGGARNLSLVDTVRQDKSSQGAISEVSGSKEEAESIRADKHDSTGDITGEQSGG